MSKLVKFNFIGPTSLLEFTRDDGSEALIEYQLYPVYAVTSYWPYENCSPAEGGDIEALEATSDGIALIQLTDAEMERAEKEIYAEPISDDYNGPEEWA